jgi:tetratricopeptide (TPR) repeat protein
MYIARRQTERALPYLREAVEILPMFRYAREQLGHAYLQVGKRKEAIPEFQRAAVAGGASDSAHLAYAYAVTNRRAEAMSILRALLASGNSRYIPPVTIAMVYVGLGDRDAALRWLERGYSEHDPVFATALSGWPAFDPLRTDPRMVTLVRRIKLTP